MNDPISYFIVVYDGAINEATALEARDLETAIAGYHNMRREKAELGRNEVQVLLVGADDIMTLEQLHLASFITSTSTDDFARPFERPAA
jgi:hypothetical protein